MSNHVGVFHLLIDLADFLNHCMVRLDPEDMDLDESDDFDIEFTSELTDRLAEIDVSSSSFEVISMESVAILGIECELELAKSIALIINNYLCEELDYDNYFVKLNEAINSNDLSEFEDEDIHGEMDIDITDESLESDDLDELVGYESTYIHTEIDYTI